MLITPDTGISLSVHKHNIDLDILCDWVEASLLFDEYTDYLSISDVIDILTGDQIYKDQSFASEIVTSAWTEIRRRHGCIGQGSPFSIASSRIVRNQEWQNFPGYSFCLILSIARMYASWSQKFGRDYTDQGQLFEELTQISLEHQLPGWTIYPTGWSRTNTMRLRELVDTIAEMLGESKGTFDTWADDDAKEKGLDLLCYRPFADLRVGIPIYLLQCSSGLNWERKLTTPELTLWTKLIQFAAMPQKAFAMPFGLVNTEFIKKCNLVNGMLLDRYRLLAPAQDKENWLPEPFRERIITWAEPRIASLQWLE